MNLPRLYFEVPVGGWFLIYDQFDRSWALFWKKHHRVDVMYVGWSGMTVALRQPPYQTNYGDDVVWHRSHQDRFLLYVLGGGERQANQCIMAATMFRTREQWWRYAARQTKEDQPDGE